MTRVLEFIVALIIVAVTGVVVGFIMPATGSVYGLTQTAIRNDMSEGLQGDATYRLSPDHTLRFGVCPCRTNSNRCSTVLYNAGCRWGRRGGREQRRPGGIHCRNSRRGRRRQHKIVNIMHRRQGMSNTVSFSNG